MKGFRELISLHLADQAKREAVLRQEELRHEIEVLDQKLAGARAGLEAAEGKLAKVQEQRRALEGEIELLEGRREKYRTQLMEAKTNEVYRTLLSEIDQAGQSISDKETGVLELMEAADGAQQEVETAQAELAKAQAANDDEAKTLAAEVDRLDGVVADAEAQAQAVEPTVPEDLVRRYRKIAEGRGGKGMALVVDHGCTECHVGIRPQVWVELLTQELLATCPGCQRLLYRAENASPDEAPASSPTASAS